ncbi:MAG: ABC transporter permease subunit [Bacteroidales bacterium]|nr:ABC transporter permease subunit [Bacteroidales bacterium]
MKKLLFLFIVLCFIACEKKEEQQPADKEITTIEDLNGKVVGTLTGSSFEIDMAGNSYFRIVRQPTLPDLIASLHKGRIDAILYDEVSLSDSLLRKNGIKIAFRTEKSYPCAFACAKSNIDLVNKFNEFLSKLKASGELLEITGKWMEAIDYAKVPMPETSDSLPGEPIVVGTYYTTAPISYMIGHDWYGFEIEILNRFGEYIGRPVEYRLFDFSALVPALQSGSIDIAGGMLFATQERQRLLALTDTYYYGYGAYFIVDKSAEKGRSVPDMSDIKGSVNSNLLVENRWLFLAKGLWVTIEITLLSLLFGSMLGIGLLAMRRSHRKWMITTAKMYSSILKGIPLVVLLMILFYIVLVGVNSVAVAVVAFSMTFASTFANMMDNAITAIGENTYKAGLALGFTPAQILRYITGPQALKDIRPQYKSEAVSLIKNTSVVGYLAIQDLTRACDMIRARTFEAVFPLFLITIIYFILAWLMGKLLDFLFKIATTI